MSKILEGNKIKKANEQVACTPEMIEEIKKCSPKHNPIDPHLYFITHFGYVKHPKLGCTLYEPYEYQYELIENYHNNRLSISMLGRQMGKALHGDTLVATPKGFVKISDIRVGDLVLDEQHEPVVVEFKTDPQYDRKLFNVKFTNGEVVKADYKHLWKVYTKNSDFERVYTTEGLVDQLKRHSVFIKKQGSIFDSNELFFEIESITETDSEPVYCIEVDSPSHLFLITESMIPTHNCVVGETEVTIRNKHTGEVQEITLHEFQKMLEED